MIPNLPPMRVVLERSVPRGSRLHAPLLQVLVGLEPLAEIAVGKLTAGEPQAPLLEHSLESQLLPQHVICFPFARAHHLAMAAIEAPDLWVKLCVVPELTPTDPSQDNPQMQTAFRRPVLSAFVDFFEAHKAWIRAQGFGEPEDWPAPLGFCWVMRNVIAHNGRIAWSDPRRRAISWRGLTYSHAQHGRQVVGQDLSEADVVLLMIDAADALDRFGAPRFD